MNTKPDKLTADVDRFVTDLFDKSAVEFVHIIQKLRDTAPDDGEEDNRKAALLIVAEANRLSEASLMVQWARLWLARDAQEQLQPGRAA